MRWRLALVRGRSADAEDFRRHAGHRAAPRPRSRRRRAPADDRAGAAWQAAESTGDWTLCGCTVAPGFRVFRIRAGTEGLGAGLIFPGLSCWAIATGRESAARCLRDASEHGAARILRDGRFAPSSGIGRRKAAIAVHAKYCPPLAVSVEPVIRPASSEARNTTQRAISSGSPSRPIGICGRMFFSSTSFGTACTISVLM